MRTPTSVFIIDPPERLTPDTDTTLAIMRESERRGHRVLFTTIDGLYLSHDQVAMCVRPIHFQAQHELFDADDEIEISGSDSDIVYMRKDPPVDIAYLHASFILDRLPNTVLQINPSRALRNHCEKFIPLAVPNLLPETLTSRDPQLIEAFLESMQSIVLKPLDDCSGRGVVTVESEDPEKRTLIAEATAFGQKFVQAQRYLPEIVNGDKRVLLLGGEILGWIRRRPAEGDFRSNVNAGGHCELCDLDNSDLDICARLGSWLRQEGIHLAGVDIVGRHVLEVNITSPSCLREMNTLTGQRLEERIVAYAESRFLDLCRP